jgi:hypothetical protein
VHVVELATGHSLNEYISVNRIMQPTSAALTNVKIRPVTVARDDEDDDDDYDEHKNDDEEEVLLNPRMNSKRNHHRTPKHRLPPPSVVIAHHNQTGSTIPDVEERQDPKEDVEEEEEEYRTATKNTSTRPHPQKQQQQQQQQELRKQHQHTQRQPPSSSWVESAENFHSLIDSFRSELDDLAHTDNFNNAVPNTHHKTSANLSRPTSPSKRKDRIKPEAETLSAIARSTQSRSTIPSSSHQSINHRSAVSSSPTTPRLYGTTDRRRSISPQDDTRFDREIHTTHGALRQQTTSAAVQAAKALVIPSSSDSAPIHRSESNSSSRSTSYYTPRRMQPREKVKSNQLACSNGDVELEPSPVHTPPFDATQRSQQQQRRSQPPTTPKFLASSNPKTNIDRLYSMSELHSQGNGSKPSTHNTPRSSVYLEDSSLDTRAPLSSLRFQRTSRTVVALLDRMSCTIESQARRINELEAENSLLHTELDRYNRLSEALSSVASTTTNNISPYHVPTSNMNMSHHHHHPMLYNRYRNTSTPVPTTHYSKNQPLFHTSQKQQHQREEDDIIENAFSPGTRVVAEIAEMMELEPGQLGQLSHIVDKYWDRLERVRTRSSHDVHQR